MVDDIFYQARRHAQCLLPRPGLVMRVVWRHHVRLHNNLVFRPFGIDSNNNTLLEDDAKIYDSILPSHLTEGLPLDV